MPQEEKEYSRILKKMYQISLCSFLKREDRRALPSQTGRSTALVYARDEIVRDLSDHTRER